jgi:hypothetical protein
VYQVQNPKFMKQPYSTLEIIAEVEPTGSRLCRRLAIGGSQRLVKSRLGHLRNQLAQFHVFALMLVLVLASGCRVTQPASASFASVEIKDRTPQQICETAATVFEEDGYRVAALSPDNMVFQKEGTRGQSMMHGGFVDTYYGAVVVVRVRAQLEPVGPDTYRLQCQAYMVRGAGDSFFEDEKRLINAKRMPYQMLLNKVASKLK